MKRIGWGWWVAIGVVVALALYIGISAATGFQTKGADDAKAETVDPRSDKAVWKAADEKCGDLVLSWWYDREGSYGNPRNVGDAWSISVKDPAGSIPGSSWRLEALYELKLKPQRGSQIKWTQVFYCDVEWNGSEYAARLVK